MTKRNAEDGLASKQRAPLFARPLAMASLVALTLVFSSCAGKGGKSDSLSLPESEAALLDPSVDSAALPVIDPSVSPDAFADLKTGATGDSAGPADGAPFYNPLGGESLGRVAYMLYGSRSERKKLLDLNPGLRGVRALAPGQTVVFSFDGLRPNPQYLTKDLLDRYSGPLAEAVRGVGKDSKQNDTVVAKGETLQEVSKRLYGTTRYWPEIYLLNVDRIKHYDKVQAGATLAVVERSALNLGSATTAPVDSQMVAGQGAFNGPVTPAPPQEMIPPPADQAPAAPIIAPAAIEAAPAEAPPAAPPVTTQPAAPVDPIPETTPAVVPVQEKAQASAPEEEGFLGSPTARRIFYVALVLLVGALGFYFTRPKQKSFDMIETATASSGGSDEQPPTRPKLPKAPPHQHLG